MTSTEAEPAVPEMLADAFESDDRLLREVVINVVAKRLFGRVW